MDHPWGYGWPTELLTRQLNVERRSANYPIKHLIAVALHVASRAPELYGPSSKAARAAEAKLRGKDRALR
eukprot:9496981-Pyramimonas_sp.AAC.1